MRINFDQNLVTLDGENLIEQVKIKTDDGKGKVENKDVLLKNVCIGALLSERQDEKATGEQKLERFELARRIHKGGIAEVTAEEIVLIKTRIATSHVTLVVGQVYEMLEQTNGNDTNRN